MSIWVHCMVKNEDRWLWFAVKSVIDHVDKILLWDTGSSDGSLEIETELMKRYPNKIILNNTTIETAQEFTNVRQEMLDITKSDWFLMLDGDEIWYESSIRKLILEINNISSGVESFVVPTVNLVGDIFHYQDSSAGRYNFGDLSGHYNLRAIKRNIPGLKSLGKHGVWGWVDNEDNMIQDRNTFQFIDAPYLHATNIQRSPVDSQVIKRVKKLKYEIGIEFPLDHYYPEVLFKDHPEIVQSPWRNTSNIYKFRALIETPIRKIKRKIIKGRVGY